MTAPFLRVGAGPAFCRARDGSMPGPSPGFTSARQHAPHRQINLEGLAHATLTCGNWPRVAAVGDRPAVRTAAVAGASEPADAAALLMRGNVGTARRSTVNRDVRRCAARPRKRRRCGSGHERRRTQGEQHETAARYPLHRPGPSEAIGSAARGKAEKLDRFRPDIMACRVTIELAGKHQHQGRAFAVRVDVTVSGHELSVHRVHDEDVYVAMREAFDDMRRQLQDSARRVQGQQKLHPATLHGEVVRFGDEGRCGFIRTPEGEEYWFGPENLAGMPFDHLEIGTSVQFIPEVAAQGRQAKRVSVGKHSVG